MGQEIICMVSHIKLDSIFCAEIGFTSVKALMYKNFIYQKLSVIVVISQGTLSL
jgi:hypothetical protein